MKKIISAILIFTLVSLTLTSCGEELGTGACEFAETRDVTGRDIHYVEMCVSGYGKLIILLDGTTAPITVNNFLNLVNEGFYNGLTFHRVINNFMIQGGDPKANGKGGADKDIVGEFLLNGYWNDISHVRGVISMARDSTSYDSASSQFFICNTDATRLNYQYAAFGYVVMGMSVVDEITAATAKYGDNNGMISQKSRQARISYIKVLENYNPKAEK